MNCPLCGGALRVVDSRPYEKSVRRRRDCEQCKYRTTTYEISTEQMIEFRKLEREKNDIMKTIRGIVNRFDGGKSNE